MVGATLFPSHRNAVAQDVDAWVGSALICVFTAIPSRAARSLQLLLQSMGGFWWFPRRPMPEREAPMDPLDVLRELEELRSLADGGRSMLDLAGRSSSGPAWGILGAERAYSVALDVACRRDRLQAELQAPAGRALSLSVSSRVPERQPRISAVSMDGPTDRGGHSVLDRWSRDCGIARARRMASTPRPSGCRRWTIAVRRNGLRYGS